MVAAGLIGVARATTVVAVAAMPNPVMIGGAARVGIVRVHMTRVRVFPAQASQHVNGYRNTLYWHYSKRHREHQFSAPPVHEAKSKHNDGAVQSSADDSATAPEFSLLT